MDRFDIYIYNYIYIILQNILEEIPNWTSIPVPKPTAWLRKSSLAVLRCVKDLNPEAALEGLAEFSHVPCQPCILQIKTLQIC